MLAKYVFLPYIVFSINYPLVIYLALFFPGLISSQQKNKC